MEISILLVDDEPGVTNSLQRSLRKQGFYLRAANSPEEALNILDEQKVDIMICDELMPGMGGTELLSLVRRRYPDTIRIILTGKATLDTAIKAINEGEVYRFLTKPCSDYELLTTIRQGINHLKLLRQSNRLLELYKRKSRILDSLESMYPGITSSMDNLDGDTSEHSTITIHESEKDFDQILEEIENEISGGDIE